MTPSRRSSNDEPRYRKFRLKGLTFKGEGRDRCGIFPSFVPRLEEGEEAVTLDAEDVIRALENGYHSQNPSPAHPADYITKRFKLDGHEGLDC